MVRAVRIFATSRALLKEVYSFHCDTAPYCESCETSEPSGDRPSNAAIDATPSSRKTCSLGPGRTVPCGIDTQDGVFVFGGDGVPSPKTQVDTATRKTCSLGPGRTVPCESKVDAEIFAFGNR